MAQTLGFILIVVLIIAFMINFVNFQSRTRRELSMYQDQVQAGMERIRQQQMEREEEQALIHKQTYIMSRAEEQIRRLEDRLIDLESLAERTEALAERYRNLE